MFKRVRELERQVAELKKELACVTGERDEAINTAVEMMHLVTYTSEVAHWKGLVCLKT